MTNTEFLRKRLLKDIPEPNKITFISFKDLERSQWCLKFLRLMKNRMIMGAFRYGTLDSQKASGKKYDNIASIQRRLKKYLQTGNDEFLIDAANECMIEYIVGEHPNKHFESVDDGGHATLKG